MNNVAVDNKRTSQAEMSSGWTDRFSWLSASQLSIITGPHRSPAGRQHKGRGGDVNATKASH